jgi:prepilin signal peptidase PulO-like enzyme (type II secretory pathway)
LVELSTAALFVISYIYWPVGFHGGGLFEFICWLLFLIGFMACAVYDLRWYLLPNKMVYPMLMLAFVQVLALTTLFHGRTGTLENALWGLLIGGGIFYLLFQASRGKWIGGGDVKLGALLGLIVGGPLKAFLLLFGASVAGTVVSIPLIVSGRMKRNSVLPFGPFLLFAAVVIRIFGASFISWSQRRGLLP